MKYPKNAYWYLQFLVGQRFDSPLVKRYMEWFPYYDIRKDEERGEGGGREGEVSEGGRRVREGK